MPQLAKVIFDCVVADHELEALGTEGERQIAATCRAHFSSQPQLYDLLVRSSQFPYHREMISTVRREIRQPLGIGFELMEEAWKWFVEPDISAVDEAVTALHLDGAKGTLPKTVGEMLDRYPGTMYLRGMYTATILLQSRLLMVYLRQLGLTPKPTTRILIATDLLGVEFAGTDLKAKLMRSGDIMRITVVLPEDLFPPWASVQSSEILRSPSTP